MLIDNIKLIKKIIYWIFVNLIDIQTLSLIIMIHSYDCLFIYKVLEKLI
jgi:hypothetical protein